MSASIRQLEDLLVRELGRVVIGAHTSVRALTVALVARGHVLVQGVPGLGKTLLAKALACALGGEFKRIQGTADLMPSDIIGVHVFDEAQRDRFMLRIDMDYPAREAEAEILTRYGGVLSAAQTALGQITVLGRALIGEARAEVEQIHVAEALVSYVLDLARASREHARLTLGLSTRGALALLKAGRIAAGLRGGDFVTPDDVKQVAVSVMAHRLVLTPEAALEGLTDLDVVGALL